MAENTVINVLDKTGVTKLWTNIKAAFVTKEHKTGSETEYKVLSDNNLTDEMVEKITNTSTLVESLGTVLTYKGSVETFDALPTDAKAGDVYNVAADSSEYVWDGSKWESLGTAVDLSGYLAKTDLVAITDAEIDAITAA